MTQVQTAVVWLMLLHEGVSARRAWSECMDWKWNWRLRGSHVCILLLLPLDFRWDHRLPARLGALHVFYGNLLFVP